MSVFGWSLPPGCGTLPGEEDDGPCLVCGKPIDECICAECPECEEQGNPECYKSHGMVMTDEQKESMAATEASWMKQAQAEAEWCKNEANRYENET